MKVQFMRNKYRDQYHGHVSFTRIGEIQEVTDAIGEYLLSTHGDKFVKIEDTPSIPIETVSDAPIDTPNAVMIANGDTSVIEFIKNNEPVGIMDIVKSLDSTYTKVKTIIDRLMKEQVLSRDPEKKYSIKRR